MPGPTPRQAGRPSELLTNVALAFMDDNADNFVAHQVFPTVPVNLSTGKYKVFPRSYFLRDEVGPRPLGGYPRQVGFKVSEDDYHVEEEALEALIDDRERADEVFPVDIEAAKVRLLVNQHLIHADRKWSNAYFGPGIWGTDLTGVAAAPGTGELLQWDNDDSNPVLDIDEAQLSVGDQVGDAFAPRVLVLGRNVYKRLKNHPLLLGRLATTDDRIVNKAVLARYFDVDKVLVPGAVWNSGPEMETNAAQESAATYERILNPNSALLVYAASAPSMQMPSGGYHFAWRRLLGARADDPRVGVERGRDERAKTDWFQVRTAWDPKVVAPELGVFFEDIVSG